MASKIQVSKVFVMSQANVMEYIVLFVELFLGLSLLWYSIKFYQNRSSIYIFHRNPGLNTVSAALSSFYNFGAAATIASHIRDPEYAIPCNTMNVVYAIAIITPFAIVLRLVMVLTVRRVRASITTAALPRLSSSLSSSAPEVLLTMTVGGDQDQSLDIQQLQHKHHNHQITCTTPTTTAATTTLSPSQLTIITQPAQVLVAANLRNTSPSPQPPLENGGLVVVGASTTALLGRHRSPKYLLDSHSPQHHRIPGVLMSDADSENDDDNGDLKKTKKTKKTDEADMRASCADTVTPRCGHRPVSSSPVHHNHYNHDAGQLYHQNRQYSMKNQHHKPMPITSVSPPPDPALMVLASFPSSSNKVVARIDKMLEMKHEHHHDHNDPHYHQHHQQGLAGQAQVPQIAPDSKLHPHTDVCAPESNLQHSLAPPSSAQPSSSQPSPPSPLKSSIWNHYAGVINHPVILSIFYSLSIVLVIASITKSDESALFDDAGRAFQCKSNMVLILIVGCYVALIVTVCAQVWWKTQRDAFFISCEYLLKALIVAVVLTAMMLISQIPRETMLSNNTYLLLNLLTDFLSWCTAQIGVYGPYKLATDGPSHWWLKRYVRIFSCRCKGLQLSDEELAPVARHITYGQWLKDAECYRDFQLYTNTEFAGESLLFAQAVKSWQKDARQRPVPRGGYLKITVEEPEPKEDGRPYSPDRDHHHHHHHHPRHHHSAAVGKAHNAGHNVGGPDPCIVDVYTLQQAVQIFTTYLGGGRLETSSFLGTGDHSEVNVSSHCKQKITSALLPYHLQDSLRSSSRQGKSVIETGYLQTKLRAFPDEVRNATQSYATAMHPYPSSQVHIVVGAFGQSTKLSGLSQHSPPGLLPTDESLKLTAIRLHSGLEKSDLLKIFDDAVVEVHRMMEKDTFQRYLNSSMFRVFATNHYPMLNGMAEAAALQQQVIKQKQNAMAPLTPTP